MPPHSLVPCRIFASFDTYPARIRSRVGYICIVGPHLLNIVIFKEKKKSYQLYSFNELIHRKSDHTNHLSRVGLRRIGINPIDIAFDLRSRNVKDEIIIIIIADKRVILHPHQPFFLSFFFSFLMLLNMFLFPNLETIAIMAHHIC